VAEGEANDCIRGFYPRQMCFIYKYLLMGLYKGKVQNIFTGSYMLPRADDKRKINVSRKKMHKKTEREVIAGHKKISVKKLKFTSFSSWGLAA
jgi:hypothetical protein